MVNADTAFGFSFPALEGGTISLADYAGRPLLVVNTASACGFTPQYQGLQNLWENYRARGLIVVGAPCNDFGHQEPGDIDDIKHFCEARFGISFPLTAKQHVVGPEAHPFYQWAREKKGWLAAPKWNFHKYLVNGEGRLVDWFATPTNPESPKVRAAIEALLPL